MISSNAHRARRHLVGERQKDRFTQVFPFPVQIGRSVSPANPDGIGTWASSAIVGNKSNKYVNAVVDLPLGTPGPATINGLRMLCSYHACLPSNPDNLVSTIAVR